MTIEELKVMFTANNADFKAKTDEMKDKLSAVSKISDQMQKTVDRGMKSSSEKTKKLAKELGTLGEKLNAQGEKIKAAASNVDYYADAVEQLKAKYQSQTDEVAKQQSKVAALEDSYTKMKEAASQFDSKIPLTQQFEEAATKVDGILNEINTLKRALSETPQGGIVDLPDTIMSIEDAKKKVSLLTKEYQEACDVADRLHNTISYVGKENAKIPLGDSLKSLKGEISAANRELSSLQAKANQTNNEMSGAAQKAANSYKQLGSASSTFDSIKTKIDETESELKSTTSFTGKFKERLGQIRASTVEKVRSGFKSAGSAISKAGSAIRSIPSHLKSIGAHAKTSASQLGKLPSALKKIGVAAAALTLVRGVFGELRSVITNYISQNDKLNARVEGMKNAFGQLLAPAIEVVVSAFEKLMPYLLAIGEAIMNVLSSLSVFSGLKKTSSAIDGVTDSTNALSKAQNELYGFDKITKQSDDKSKTPATNYSPADIGSIDEIISRITSSINKALASIDWDSVKQKAVSFAKDVSDAFDQFFNGIDWKLMGENITLGLSSVGKTVQGFAEKMDWSSISKSINSFFAGIDLSTATDELAKGINESIKGLRTSLQGINWSDIGKTVADGINGIFKIDWSEVGGLLSDGVSGAFKTLASTLENLDWRGLAQQLIGFIRGIDWESIASSIFESLGAALGGISAFIDELWTNAKESISAYFSQYVDWGDTPGNIIKGLLQGIGDAVSNIGKWIKEHIFQPFIDGFKAAFGIHSPSTVMAEQGSYIIDGLKEGIGDIWTKIKEKFTSLLTSIKDWFTEKKQDLTDSWNTFTSGIKDKAVKITAEAKEKVEGALEKLKTGISGIKDKTATVKTAVKDTFAKYSGGVSEWWKKKKESMTDKNATVKTAVKDTFSKYPKGISEWWSNKKKSMTDKTANVKTAASDKVGVSKWWADKKKSITDKTATVRSKFEDIKGGIVEKWNGIKGKVSSFTSTVTANFSDKVSSSIKSIVRQIVDFVNNMVDKVNKVLPAKYEIGHIEYPTWAFAKGGIVDSPTYAMIGEAGKEAVMPLENNTGWIDELARRIAMMIGSFSPSSGGQSGGIVVPIYIGSKKITEVVIDDINKVTASTGRCPIKI